MKDSKSGAACDEWLSLAQASSRLGVHPATLRRWADQRAIPVLLTPGGHRRFRGSDVRSFERQRRRAGPPTSFAQAWADLAIDRAHEVLAGQRWAEAYDEDERRARRDQGQRLVGLVLQLASEAGEDAEALFEAREIGAQHARVGLLHRQQLVDLLRIVGLVRSALVEMTLQGQWGQPLEQPYAASLLLRIERVVDEVQIGVVEPYANDTTAAQRC